MRIALHPTSEVGLKAGRLLLGEGELEALGVLDRPVDTREPRVQRITSLNGFDVAVTDDPDIGIASDALAAGVPLVVWVDGEGFDTSAATVPVLTGANLATGIARALAAREAASRPTATVVAWTEPGKPLRTGEPVTFPDPVGARWGKVRHRERHRTEVVVPIAGDWAGAVIHTTVDGTTRILGIADDATHLEALALAAGAVVLANGPHPAGGLAPDDVADAYVLAALRAGLDIASFTKA
jgi:hypothetical protein